MAEYSFIPYGRQTLEEEDENAILEVLRENQFLTTGPRVTQFEAAVCDYLRNHATGRSSSNLNGGSSSNLNGGSSGSLKGLDGVAVNSGTAALHAMIRAIQLQPGDEVIVPAISFAATSNCVLYERGIPVFCDVEEETLNLDPTKVEALITDRTVAVIAVDFAGQLAKYGQLREICNRRGLWLLSDAAHSIGLVGIVEDSKSESDSNHRGHYCGDHYYGAGLEADLTATSFHPVKNLTTAEGGMVLGTDSELIKRMKRFRNHGIDTEYQNRVSHAYDIIELGYNYRLTDLQCALGISQLKRVKGWIDRRVELAKRYDGAFAAYSDLVTPLMCHRPSAYHIYVLKFHLEGIKDKECAGWTRDRVFEYLREQKIGVNVHYKPIYLHSYYQSLENVRHERGLCPVAEKVYDQMITIPLFPAMSELEQDRVISTIYRLLDEIKVKRISKKG